MDPKLIFLLAVSAFIVAEIATLGWLLTRNPDDEDPKSGAMVQDRQPYLEFLFGESFGEEHGEFSFATHENYSASVEALEDIINERRGECKHDENIFPDYPGSECSRENRYGFHVVEDDKDTDFLKPCLYLRIRNADKLEPVSEGDIGKQTDSYSVLCQSLLFGSKESTVPERGLPMNVFPPNGLKKKVYPLADKDKLFCSPVVAIQLDLQAVGTYARAEIECQIYVEESTTFDRRKAELKLDINLSHNDNADALLQNVLSTIKENADSLGNLEENPDFVSKMVELKTELASTVDESQLNYTFAPSEQHLKNLEKAIEEYQAGNNSGNIIRQADSKQEQLKTTIAEITNNFLENIGSNNTKLRETLYDMEEQINSVTSESDQKDQHAVLNQIRDISKSISKQKGDNQFEQALVGLANPFFLTLQEYADSENKNQNVSEATNRTRQVLTEFIQRKIEDRINILSKEADDPVASKGKKKKIKRIIEVVDRLRKRVEDKSNDTAIDRQLLQDYEELMMGIESERNAVHVEGTDEKKIDEQKRELTRLLQFLTPKPSQGLESVDENLEKTKEDLEAQVALVQRPKKKRKIKQIITIIDRLKSRSNSTILNETVAEQLEKALNEVSKSFVMTDEELNNLIDKLYDVSGPLVLRNETSQLQEISEIASSICPTVNGYNCTIADEEEALALLQEVWKKPDKAILENEEINEKIDELVELLQEINDLEEDQETFLTRVEEDLQKSRLKNKKKKIIKRIFELHERNKTAYPIPPGLKGVLENLSNRNDTQLSSSSLDEKYDKVMELLAHISEEPSGLSELLTQVEEEENREVENIVKDLVNFIGGAVDGDPAFKGKLEDQDRNKMEKLLEEINYVKERIIDDSKDAIRNVTNEFAKKEDSPRFMKEFVKNVTKILGIAESQSDRFTTFKRFIEDAIKDEAHVESVRSENQEEIKRFLTEIIGLDDEDKKNWSAVVSNAKAKAHESNIAPYVEQFLEQASLLLGISPMEIQIEESPIMETVNNRITNKKDKALVGQESKQTLMQIMASVEPFVQDDELYRQLVDEKAVIKEVSPLHDVSKSFTKTADIITTELALVQEQEDLVKKLLKELNSSGEAHNLGISEKLANITNDIEMYVIPELQLRKADDHNKLLTTQDELMKMLGSTYEDMHDLEQLGKNLDDVRKILHENSFENLTSTVDELKREVSNGILVKQNTEKLRDIVGRDYGNHLKGASFQEVYNAGETYLSNNQNKRDGLRKNLLEILDEINTSNATFPHKQKVKVLRTLLEEVLSLQPNETSNSELSIKQLSLRSGVPNILLHRISNLLENGIDEESKLKSTVKELVDELTDENNHELLEVITTNAKPNNPRRASGLTPNSFIRKLNQFEEAVARDPERGRNGQDTFDDQRRALGKDLEKLLRSERLKSTEHILNYPSDMSLLQSTFQTLTLLNKGNISCSGITIPARTVDHYRDILRQEGLEDSPLNVFFELLGPIQAGDNTSKLYDAAAEVLLDTSLRTSLLSDQSLLDLIKRAASCSSRKVVDNLVDDLAMIQRMFTSKVFNEETARTRMYACYPKLPIHLLENLTFRYLTEASQTELLLKMFALKVKTTLTSLANDSVSVPAQETLGKYLSVMSNTETITIDAERADQLRKILRAYQAAIISSSSLTQPKVDEILAKLDLTESLIRLSVKLGIVSDSVSKILDDTRSTEAKRISSLKLLYQKIEEAQLVLQLKNASSVNERLRDFIFEFKEKLEDPNQSCEKIGDGLAESGNTPVDLHGIATGMSSGIHVSSSNSHKIISQNNTADVVAMCRLLQRHTSCPDVCKNLTVLLEMMRKQGVGDNAIGGEEDKRELDTSEETTSSSEDTDMINRILHPPIPPAQRPAANDTEKNLTITSTSTTATSTAASPAVTIVTEKTTEIQRTNIDSTWLLELNGILSNSSSSTTDQTIPATTATVPTTPTTVPTIPATVTSVLPVTTSTHGTLLHTSSTVRPTEAVTKMSSTNVVTESSAMDYETDTEPESRRTEESQTDQQHDGFDYQTEGEQPSAGTKKEEPRHIEEREGQQVGVEDYDFHNAVTKKSAETTVEEEDEGEYEYVTEILQKVYDEHGQLIAEEHLSGSELDSILRSNSTSAAGVERRIEVSEVTEIVDKPSGGKRRVEEVDEFEKMRMKGKEGRSNDGQGKQLGKFNGKHGIKH